MVQIEIETQPSRLASTLIRCSSCFQYRRDTPPIQKPTGANIEMQAGKSQKSPREIPNVGRGQVLGFD